MLEIRKNVILAPYTTFKIGGVAKNFTEVGSEEEILEALAYAKENNLEFFILGGGSNVLFSDNGFDGLIIKLKNSQLKADPCLPDRQAPKAEKVILNCWAGDNLASVVNNSLDNNSTGIEWAAGIPGTVGGAIRGNAGAFGGCMADSVESVSVIVNKKADPSTSPAKAEFAQNDIQIVNYKLADCKFSYRGSIFKQNSNLIILSCVLKLQNGIGKEIKNKIKENIEKRAKNQPKEPSSGSFFKNPVVENKKLIEKFEEDLKVKCEDNKIPAGWLIGEAGLQGKKIGGAMVSKKHNNFIINTGKAKGEDVIMLTSLIKQQMRDKFGVELQEEVQLIGF